MAYLGSAGGGYLSAPPNSVPGGSFDGDVTINGTLRVTGAVTADAAVSVGGDLAANGHVTLATDKQLRLPVGSVGAPSLAFVGSLTTGLYAPAADQIGQAVAGALKTTNSAAAFTLSAGQLVLPAGLASAPSLVFAGSLATGLYQDAADRVSIARASTHMFQIASGGTTVVTGALSLPPGSAAAPSLKFSGSTNTGWSAQTADTLITSIGGAAVDTRVSTGVTFAQPITLPAGSLAAPALRFAGSDPGTGFSAATADNIVMGRAGVARMTNTATTIDFGVFTNVNATLQINGSFRAGAVSLSSDTTLTTSSYLIVANAGCTQLTLPATAGASQQLLIHNRSGAAITIAVNGHTVNGSTSNFTLAAGASLYMSNTSGTSAATWSAFEGPGANVPFTFNQDVTMATGKVLTLAAGSLAAPALRFAGSDPGTGFSAATADTVVHGRVGVNQFHTNSSGISVNVALTANGGVTTTGSLNIAAKLGVAAESIKTVNYQIANTDCLVPLNDGGGAALTATSPATPGGDQTLILLNLGTSAATFARNGTTVNGLAADVTVPAGGIRILSWNNTTWATAAGA